MASEIRVNSLSSRTGLSTVTFTDTGPIFSGITTFQDNSGFNVGTGGSIFSPASNTVTLGTNDAERLRIDSGGSIAIGVNSPSDKLHVGGNNAFIRVDRPNGNPGLTLIYNSTNSTRGDIDLTTGGDLRFATNNSTERVRIDSSGNMQVSTGQFTVGTTASTGLQLINDGTFGTIQSADLKIRTAATERLRITSAGLVGVNCTPLSQFQVKSGTNQNIALSSMSSEAAIEAFNDAGSANVPLRIRGSAVKLYANNALKLDVQSAQSYLYGTSDGILNLDTTDGRGTFIRFKENGTTKAWVGCAEGMGGGTSSPDQDDLGLRATGNILFSSNGGERLRITENGRVLINRSTATGQAINNLNGDVKLVVNGATITKHGYKADVGTSYVSIPGATVGNETSVFLVTVQGNGGGNFHSSATYILCSGAYNKTFTQLGTAAGHFGNGTVQAQLSSYSGTSSSVQVRRSGSSGTCNVQVHMFQLL